MSPQRPFFGALRCAGSKKRISFRALRCAGSKKRVSFRPCVAQEAKKGSLSGPALRRKQKRVSFGPCVTQEAKKGSLSGPALRRKQKRGLFRALRYAGSKKGVSFGPCVTQEAKKGVSFGALRYARTQNLTPQALKRPASARAATNVERFSYPRPPPHDHSAPSGTVWGANAIRPYMYQANFAGVRRRLTHRPADCRSFARRREGG